MSVHALRRDVPAYEQRTSPLCACCGSVAVHTIRGHIPACTSCRDLDSVLVGFSPYLLEQYVRTLFLEGAA